MTTKKTPPKKIAPKTEVKRRGRVAIVGLPNAGKSTLYNLLLGQTISAVSPKVQTTRLLLRGEQQYDTAMIEWMDTPGVFKQARHLMDRAMLQSIRTALAEADVVIALIDASSPPQGEAMKLFQQMLPESGHLFIALNKVDAVKPRTKLLVQAEAWQKLRPDAAAILMLSATTGDGVDGMLKEVVARLPAVVAAPVKSSASTLELKWQLAEMTRAVALTKLNDELPYEILVETTSLKTAPRGALKCAQTIYINKPRHRAIVLGRGGQMLKTIGMLSRQQMKRAIGKVVHLSLQVEVLENWPNQEAILRRCGFLQ